MTRLKRQLSFDSLESRLALAGDILPSGGFFPEFPPDPPAQESQESQWVEGSGVGGDWSSPIEPPDLPPGGTPWSVGPNADGTAATPAPGPISPF